MTVATGHGLGGADVDNKGSAVSPVPLLLAPEVVTCLHRNRELRPPPSRIIGGVGSGVRRESKEGRELRILGHMAQIRVGKRRETPRQKWEAGKEVPSKDFIPGLVGKGDWVRSKQ